MECKNFQKILAFALSRCYNTNKQRAGALKAFDVQASCCSLINQKEVSPPEVFKDLQS